MSDKAQCFTTVLMKELTAQQEIDWKTMLAYEPMSNGRAERMVQNVKASVGKISRDHEEYWDENIRRVVYIVVGRWSAAVPHSNLCTMSHRV